MKRKKVIIIVLLVIFIIVLTGALFIGYKEKSQRTIQNNEQTKSSEEANERYSEIKKGFEIALKKQINASFVIKDDYNCHNFNEGFVTSDGLIMYRLLNKSEMLDIDGVSFCKAVAREYVELTPNSKDQCEMKYDIYIKCKNYMTPGFDSQEYRDFINVKK